MTDCKCLGCITGIPHFHRSGKPRSLQLSEAGSDDAAATERCVDVRFEMGDGSYERNTPWYDGGGVGALVWNPKGGEGHVLVREVRCRTRIPEGERHAGALYDCGCGGYPNSCDQTVLVCECGEDNAWRDHHYMLLRASVSAGERDSE